MATTSEVVISYNKYKGKMKKESSKLYRNIYYERSIYYDHRKVPMSSEAYAHRFIFSFIIVTALITYFIFQAALYNMKNKKPSPEAAAEQDSP